MTRDTTFTSITAIVVLGVVLVADLVEGFAGFPAQDHLLGYRQCGNDHLVGGTLGASASRRRGSAFAVFASAGAISDADQTEFIVKALQSSNGVFDRLSSEEIEALGSAFEPVTIPEGTDICQQGDAGDYFYVIGSGNVKFSVDEFEVGTATDGKCFGELALVEEGGGTRAATATTFGGDVSLYRVDRNTFRSVLGEDTLRRVGVRADFIKEALGFSFVFDEIDDEDMNTLVQAFESYDVSQGEDICRQGEAGDYFYVIQSGTVKFTVDGKEVGTAGVAQCFGELALVDDQIKRAATCTAYGGPVSLYRVDRNTFRSVLGEKTLRNVDVYTKRGEIKKKLEEAAIKSFSEELPERYCENLMEELEEMRPIARPAFHPSMNGDWCMVRAEVNTMDMTLIQTLSIISRLFPFLVDFTDCYIGLSNGATLVTCYIFLKLFGTIPFKMNAYTKMELDDSHPEGTLMYESFQGASIMGIDLPLPNMAVARPLEITYLDEDIMIARNDGGEPHLLVRIRSCPEEDPDHEFTGFFEDARLLYGDRITRCLVDRRFGEKQEDDEAEKLKAALERAKNLAVSNTRDRLYMLD